MKVIVIVVALILAAAQAHNARSKIFYLADRQSQTALPGLAELENNPYKLPVEVLYCKQDINKCLRFKAKDEYPQLVFWNGPGSGFKLLGEPTVNNLNIFFQRKNENPIRPLRDFLEDITLFQSFLLSGVVIFILHSIFSVIFKDRSGLSSAATDKKKN